MTQTSKDIFNSLLMDTTYLKYKKKYKQLYDKYPHYKSFFKAWTITTIVVGTFLMYPTIIKQVLTIMSCDQYGDKFYLVEDLSIVESLDAAISLNWEDIEFAAYYVIYESGQEIDTVTISEYIHSDLLVSDSNDNQITYNYHVKVI